MRQNITTKPITTIRVLNPILPTRFKQITRSQERVIPKQGGDGKQIKRAIRRLDIFNMSSQVRQLGLDGGTEFILGQETWGSVCFEDG